jgi:hypothetical protein
MVYVGIDCSSPGHVVGVKETLRIKEGQNHLLLPHSVYFGLDWSRLPLL